MGLLFKKDKPTDKIGRVRKCPRCGAAVPSSKVICPECGWEFDDGKDKESALQRLSAKLEKCHGFFSSKSEGDVVRNFPIPKSKNDLLELTIYFKSRKHEILQVEDEEGDMRKCRVFNDKYEECILKAKMFYSADPEFRMLINEYEHDKKLKRIWIALAVAVSVIGIACGLLLYLL